MCECVCVCVRERESVCVRACVCVCIAYCVVNRRCTLGTCISCILHAILQHSPLFQQMPARRSNIHGDMCVPRHKTPAFADFRLELGKALKKKMPFMYGKYSVVVRGLQYGL